MFKTSTIHSTYIRLIVILFISIFFSANLSAQGKHTKWYFEATVELYNGSILKGELVEHTDSLIKIELLGGSILAYPKSEVKSVHVSDQKVYKKVKTYIFQRSGWNVSLFANLNLGQDDAGVGGFLNVGYQFNDHVNIGVGTGLQQYSTWEGTASIPIYAFLSGNFLEAPNTPYYHVAAGFGLATPFGDDFYDDAEGGLYVHPSLGMRFDLYKGTSFLLEMGYQFHNARFSRTDWNGFPQIDEINYRKFTLKIGWEF